MKICPVCLTQYEDDSSEKCTKDNTMLVPAEKLESNPPTPTIVPAAPDANTSDFDLEAIHSEFENQKSEIPLPPSPEPIPDTPVEIKPSKPRSKIMMIAIAALLLMGGGIGIYEWLYHSPRTVPIELQSNPIGATVYFDGKLIGVAPATLRTTKGLHKVVFEHIGYETVEETIEVGNEGHVFVKKRVTK